MNDSDVNQIISKFMGAFDGTDHELNTIQYTESLDVLVPIWEKLEVSPDFEWTDNVDWWVCWIYRKSNSIASATEKPVQRAAAHATAKAIIVINGCQHSDGENNE